MVQEDAPNDALKYRMRIFHVYTRKFQLKKLLHGHRAPSFGERDHNAIGIFPFNHPANVGGSTDDSWIYQRFANVFPSFVEKTQNFVIEFRVLNHLPYQIDTRSSSTQDQHSLRLP